VLRVEIAVVRALWVVRTDYVVCVKLVSVLMIGKEKEEK
jgi:hypothetical protein